MRALVTGATGFVGGRLAVRLLERGDQVVTLCRDGDPPAGCEVVRGELEDLRTCERAINEHQPDMIFHLAAQAIVPHAKRDPFSTLETNVRGTYNLLEAYRRHRKHRSTLVVASSDKAYGELRERAYYEDDPLAGRGPYDVSKSCTDLIAQSYAFEYHIPIGVVRAGNIYGPGDSDKTRIIPTIVDSLTKGNPVEILSDGSPIRDYIWIDDVVDGYLRTASYVSPISGARDAEWPFCVNLAGGEPVSVLDLVRIATEEWKALRDLSHYYDPVIKGTRTGEINTQILSTSRARAKLGWRPSVPLREGLRRTLVNSYT